MQRFYLFKREKIWYINLINPETGKKITAKSSGTEDRQEAEYIAQKWLYEGVPSGKTSEPRSFREIKSIDKILTELKSLECLTREDVQKFLNHFKNQGFIVSDRVQKNSDANLFGFLEEFWDYDKSPYVKEKLSHGHSITRNYCQGMERHIKRRWKTYFKDIPLHELHRQDLKDFSQHLAESEVIGQNGKPNGKLLAHQSINRILTVGTIAFKWACDNGILETDPGKNLPKFSGKAKRRGVLSDDEVNKLFSAPWFGNPANRLGNLLSCQSGLRLGEVVALRVEDIQNGYIHVRHSWSEVDGLKAPKNGEERIVPLLPDLEKELLKHARLNPAGCGPTSWIFWALDRKDGPHRGQNISSALNTALENIKIDHEERLSRGLTFHSWRHYYAKKMADALDIRAAKLTGHKTPAMLEHYADHAEQKDLKKAAEATAEVFGRILAFKSAQ